MDWARTIEINHLALTRIVAALIAAVGLAGGCTAARLPQPVYRAVLRVLYPLESAVRRLIVIAARGAVIALPPACPMPEGLALGRRRGGGRISFQLFDARCGVAQGRKALVKVAPSIRVFGFSPLVPVFQPQPATKPLPEPDDGIAALRLSRRLAAVKLALETLPRQVKRLKRWQIRRERMRSPKFKSPLRPGPPPGHRKLAKDEIDWVLRECHALAWDALKVDTS